MATIAEHIGNGKVTELAKLVSGSVVCQCGRAKSRAHLFCPKCSSTRLPGYFIADMPEGTYVENGMESPDAMAMRLGLV